VIETPVFMPVGTLASVKALDAEDLEKLDARIILANAYHLMLRPGDALVQRLGGLHAFMGRKNGAILTDSGGFQVFSLTEFRKLTDEGIQFRSHIDGSLHHLTPERLVELQENLAPDIAMVLDECPPGNATREQVQQACIRSTQWAERCQTARKRRADVAFFGIVQGGLHENLRAQHAAEIAALNFEGNAIGGVSVGEDPLEIDRIVRFTAPLLPRHKPRYLMGVGTPQDLIRGVAAGVDMFDCVMPSRNARNGQLFTSKGKVSIRNAQYREDLKPIDESCDCYTCTHFSRAYLRHLFVAGELSYYRLATLHNLAFYLNLMQRIRQAIAEDAFDSETFLGSIAGP
jgi:queuine tRNA-ribosyltransferase